jgi:hypothetical protein
MEGAADEVCLPSLHAENRMAVPFRNARACGTRRMCQRVCGKLYCCGGRWPTTRDWSCVVDSQRLDCPVINRYDVRRANFEERRRDRCWKRSGRGCGTPTLWTAGTPLGGRCCLMQPWKPYRRMDGKDNDVLADRVRQGVPVNEDNRRLRAPASAAKNVKL